jgi:hypothetical protein
LRGLFGFDSDAFKRLALGKRFAACQTLESLNGAVTVGKAAKLFDFLTLTTMTLHDNCLAFRAAKSYRDSDS